MCRQSRARVWMRSERLQPHLDVGVVAALQLLLEHLARDAHERADKRARKRGERLRLHVRQAQRRKRHEARLVRARADAVARERAASGRDDPAVDRFAAQRRRLLHDRRDAGAGDGLHARFERVQRVQHERGEARGEAAGERRLEQHLERAVRLLALACTAATRVPTPKPTSVKCCLLLVASATSARCASDSALEPLPHALERTLAAYQCASIHGMLAIGEGHAPLRGTQVAHSNHVTLASVSRMSLSRGMSTAKRRNSPYAMLASSALPSARIIAAALPSVAGRPSLPSDAAHTQSGSFAFMLPALLLLQRVHADETEKGRPTPQSVHSVSVECMQTEKGRPNLVESACVERVHVCAHLHKAACASVNV